MCLLSILWFLSANLFAVSLPNVSAPLPSYKSPIIPIQTDSEELVRLCTMVSCPTCGEVRPADTMTAHYRMHRFGTGPVECQWEGCDTILQFTSLKVHIENPHLKVAMRHCPYCHRETSCYEGARGHNAKDCEMRDAARRGEKSSRKTRARCPMWCRALTLPENLPESYHIRRIMLMSYFVRICLDAPQWIYHLVSYIREPISMQTAVMTIEVFSKKH